MVIIEVAICLIDLRTVVKIVGKGREVEQKRNEYIRPGFLKLTLEPSEALVKEGIPNRRSTWGKSSEMEVRYSLRYFLPF
jgi:hypothetical protein